MRKALTFLFFASALYGQELTFQGVDGEKKTLSKKALAELVSPQMVNAWEPHEKRDLQFRAFPLKQLLTSVFGPKWKQADEILFTCRDGYQPSLPVATALKNEGLLAFEIFGRSFSIYEPFLKKKVQVGPYYLVWKTKGKKMPATEYPYQVTGIEIVDFKKKYPKISPPSDDPAVLRGFSAFRTRCLRCHQINGQGGKKSVELNYPVSVTEYFKEDWLVKWIQSPRSIRHNSEMPGLGPGAKNTQVAKDIVAYLKAMRFRKHSP